MIDTAFVNIWGLTAGAVAWDPDRQLALLDELFPLCKRFFRRQQRFFSKKARAQPLHQDVDVKRHVLTRQRLPDIHTDRVAQPVFRRFQFVVVLFIVLSERETARKHSRGRDDDEIAIHFE